MPWSVCAHIICAIKLIIHVSPYYIKLYKLSTNYTLHFTVASHSVTPLLMSSSTHTHLHTQTWMSSTGLNKPTHFFRMAPEFLTLNWTLVCVASPELGLDAPQFIWGGCAGCARRRRRGERESQEGVTNIALLLSPRPVTSFIGSEGSGATGGWMKRERASTWCVCEEVRAGRTRSPRRWCSRELTGSSDVSPAEELWDEARLGAALLISGAVVCEIIAWLFFFFSPAAELRTRCPFVTKCAVVVMVVVVVGGAHVSCWSSLGHKRRTWVRHRVGWSYVDIAFASIAQASESLRWTAS